jgi:hypothetical protein
MLLFTESFGRTAFSSDGCGSMKKNSFYVQQFAASLNYP